jgi:hypothetical protein
MALTATLQMDFVDLVKLSECIWVETEESFGIVTGSQPSSFMPEPKRIKDLAHLNKHLQKVWTKAIV